jgi:hybrid cluster-associated redox disulfide protein
MTMARIQIDDPDLPLSRLLARWPRTLHVFMAHRMMCIGCPITPFHTVIDACIEYNLDEAAFRAELRAAISVNRSQEAC